MSVFLQICSNKIIVLSVVAWGMAQLIKIIIELISNKNLNLSLIFSSGGMPSSHSSFVTAMAISVGLQEGFLSTYFSIAFVISLIVMYDAAGVRRAAGKQAEVLNILIKKLEKQNIKIDEKLKVILGHSPIEVAMGALLGIFVAISLY